MKKAAIIAAVALALVVLVASVAPSAMAVPTKTKACSGCHRLTTAVKVTVTKVSSTTKTVKYKVAVTGGKGAAGWAVLGSGKNLARRLAATGTFTVAKGRVIKVWGVKKGTGSRYKALTAK